ncbi:hypothetical protein [Lutibaculum baratangense]|uniref:Lipoprotein n=1 Tax=Lutibaculum baratangense AMV1 TaxID=631454 RepID=V4RIT4_9HYPH|nr:hypothetical protein [Lutibaculum baratangense]ESR23185.1 hypothetical protein N177_3253 [Lutibaculum baratangense AMV1]
MKGILVAAILAGATAGCVTTEQANQAIQMQWTGQPSDAFFSAYGPPVSEYRLNDGGTLYTWRGGETQRNVPPVYRQMTEEEKKRQPAQQTIINVNTYGSPNWTPPPPPGQVLVSPGRYEYLGCEAQIATDRQGIITSIRTSKDSDGEGLAFSRCAEVFGVRG